MRRDAEAPVKGRPSACDAYGKRSCFWVCWADLADARRPDTVRIIQYTAMRPTLMSGHFMSMGTRLFSSCIILGKTATPTVIPATSFMALRAVRSAAMLAAAFASTSASKPNPTIYSVAPDFPGIAARCHQRGEGVDDRRDDLRVVFDSQSRQHDCLLARNAPSSDGSAVASCACATGDRRSCDRCRRLPRPARYCLRIARAGCACRPPRTN